MINSTRNVPGIVSRSSDRAGGHSEASPFTPPNFLDRFSARYAQSATEPFYRQEEEVSTYVSVVDYAGLPAVGRPGRRFHCHADASWAKHRSGRHPEGLDI